MLNLRSDMSYYVFSIDDPEHKLSRFRAVCNEKGLPVREMRGRYHGQEEPAFLVPSSVPFMVHVWPWVRGQETILYIGAVSVLDGARHADLLPVNENGLGISIMDLSPWRAVDVHTARAQDGFTYDYATNTYYVAGPLDGASPDVAGAQPRAFPDEPNWVA